ncbi:MAG: hypothetical protein AAF585_00245 [Verrucomicrobiota bacterium]
MTSETQLVQYLWPYPGAFWRWSLDAEAVVWKEDGATLAFYEEVESTLRQLQTHGWPRFEDVVVFLAVCRSNWCDDFQNRIFQSTSPDSVRIGDSLIKIHEVAKRAGFSAGCAAEILEMLLPFHERVFSPDEAAALLSALQSGDAAVKIRERALISEIDPDAKKLSANLTAMFYRLVEAIEPLDPATNLETFSETSLPDVPAVAEIDDLPLVERIRALVRTLVDSDEQDLAGVARIARNLSAVVSLPRPVSEPQEMPVGGYSDVANRGSLDRLLVSELAQDPDVLAVRVALNEALYLRRESPPRQPPRDRAIFIDTGIRMWGLPRVFAGSLALAFCIQSDRKSEPQVFTESGEARIDTKDGVVDLLGRLTPASRPGNSLDEFLGEYGIGDADCILITTSAVVADRRFKQKLAAHADADFFIATVDREGRYELFTSSPAGQRQLQKARLELDKLFAGKTDGFDPTPQLLANRGEWLPRILRQSDFSLRLAATVPVENTIYDSNVGLVAYSKDGLLLHWDDPSRGAAQVSDTFPPGFVSWSEIDAAQQTAYFFIPRAGGSALLVSADLNLGEMRQIRIAHGLDRVLHVCRIGQVLVLLGHLRASGHHLQSGEQLFGHVTENLGQRSERFVFTDRQWFAMNIGAQGLWLEHLPTPTGQQVVFIWESSDWPAPLALTKELSVYCLIDPPEIVVGPETAFFKRIERVSADGTRLLTLAQPIGQEVPKRYLIDLVAHKTQEHNSSTFHRLEPEAMRMTERVPAVRNRYLSIAVGSLGQLFITSRKKTVFALTNETSGIPRLEWKPVRTRLSEGAWRPFEDHDAPAGARFGMKRAQWDDGSIALMDYRGWLHLKSADKSIPEVTLTLKDGLISGWASTGEWIGNPYFVGDHPTVEPSLFFDYVSLFAERLNQPSATPVTVA